MISIPDNENNLQSSHDYINNLEVEQDRKTQTTIKFPTQAQMNAFNDLYQESHNLQAENTQWREKYAELEEELERKEHMIHQLEMDKMYEDELFTNTTLSPSHKIVLRAIRRIIHTLRVEDTIPTAIHLSELANKTGLSESQIRRLTDELNEWGIITKTTRQWKEGKKWISEMKIAIGGKIKSSAKDIITPHKRPGGQRCHNCGSKNIEMVVYQCLDCGHHGPTES